jgi:hypothetical protein
MDQEKERVAESELAAIDAEAKTVCQECAWLGPVYWGNVVDVTRAVDADLGRAHWLGQRLTQLRDSLPTPRWQIVTFARAGALWDCIWSRLRDANPAYFSPAQEALMVRLNQLAVRLNAAGTSSLGPSPNPSTTSDPKDQVRAKWRATKDKYLDVLESKMVPAYVTATLLARRYALGGLEVSRANDRLRGIASTLGDDKMRLFLANMVDPTDPEEGRRLVYVPGAFSVAP